MQFYSTFIYLSSFSKLSKSWHSWPWPDLDS